MNLVIEAGKYYRMRCGGAVRIDEIEFGDWTKNGKSIYDRLFDLVAEITEAEYNRIVSGEPAGNTGLMESALQVEINVLKAKNELLQKQNEETIRMYRSAMEFNDELQESRRFEAAKAAMQGLHSDRKIIKWIQEMQVDNTVTEDVIAKMAVMSADALLKALEVKE